MDFQLIALIGLIVFTLVIGIKTDSRGWPGRPGHQYQRVLSIGAIGLLFTVSGAIGWDLSNSSGWFQGTEWVEPPVWWQLGAGLALLTLAIYLGRRVPAPTRTTANRTTALR